MKNTTLVVVGFIVAAMWSACSKKEKEYVPFYQKYEVHYDRTDDTTILSALLRLDNEKGPYVKILDDQVITANGITSNGQQLIDVVYAKGWGFHGTPDMDIVFNKSGVALTNSLKLSDAGDIALSATDDTIVYRNKPLVIHWTGSPQLPEDYMYAAISSEIGPLGNTSYSVETQGDSAVWSETYMRSFEPGRHKISLTRRRTLPLDQNDGAASGKRVVQVTIYRWIEVR